MGLVQLIIGLALFLAVAMAVAWSIALTTSNAGWADVFWSLAIGVGGVAAALAPVGFEGSLTARAVLVAVVVAAWSLRLGGHIFGRARKGKNDPRYQQLEDEWGESFRLRLFGFLEIQAAVALVLVLAVLIAARNPAPLGVLDAIAVLVGIVAIVGEGIADAQLRRFSRDPVNKGKVCDVGLWSASRHPNYFFEWLHWLAYLFFGISFSAPYSSGWLTILGPAIMYLLLVKVSGLPPLEAHMLRSRGDAFRAYQQRVRAFWPIPKSAG